MNKQKLQPLKGFRDFLPEEAKKRQYVINSLRKTFELFGFEPLETPALEYQELLLGKTGEEGNKLIYTFKDKGGRDVALRYDQTVPTARILAMYHQTLPMPWRRYQVQPVWRAENPQRGRFREFLHCDADIYGSPSPLADAEIIVLSQEIFKKLGFSKFIIFLNDRKILFDIMDFVSIPKNLHFSVIQLIDKLDRKSKEEVSDALKEKGLSKKTIDHLFNHLDSAKPTKALSNIIKSAINLGADKKRLSFQARLARGLDYYTSTIFEIKIKDYKAGSVLGGGRYDKLIEDLSGINVPAVGFGLGFDRTIEAMEQFKLFPKEKTTTSALVTVFSKDFIKMSTMVAQNLRENGVSTEVYPNEKVSLKKQLKYADKKGVRWLIVIGPREVEKNTVILKNLKTGRQEDVRLKNLAGKVKK
jgi:histidyl-tRNA synthetase